MLTPAERARYARHLTLPQVGERGQQRLKDSSVLVVGAGGLGSPAALYLAAAGVGRIGIVDDDRVDATNLQRQVLYGERNVGARKVAAASERLLDLNPHIDIVAHQARLTSDNALETIGPYDVVVDGSDNFPTRYLVNDACVLTGVPDVYGSIFRFEGQVSVFATRGGPCYRCLFARPPAPDVVPSCADAGVLGVLPGIIGSIQANEALKTLLGIGDTLAGRLLLFDALRMEFNEVRVARKPACAVCGDQPTVREPIDYEAFCAGTVQAPRASTGTWSPAHLKSSLDAGVPLLIVDVREDDEVRAGMIPGAIHIPLAQIRPRAATLPRERPIVLYCRSGGRSGKATRILREAGHGDVHNLEGGIEAWQRAAFPVVRPA